MNQLFVKSNLYSRIKILARKMRKNSTEAEIYFWDKVRNRKLFGLKWNRQYIIECQRDLKFTKYYIADFHCHSLKLIVEIDGEIHNDQQSADLMRTEELKAFGFKVVRFSNEEILNNWDEIVKIISGLYNAKMNEVDS